VELVNEDIKELIDFLEKHTQYYKRKLVLDMIAENARLKEALQDIAIAKYCEGYGEVLGGKLMELARQALGKIRQVT
jgi:hypothetical protein